MKNSIEIILEKLNYKNTLIEHVPTLLKQIDELTAAEIRFFTDCRTGTVDLTAERELNTLNASLKHKVIRSELLEWALNSEATPYFFPSGKIVLIAAIIDRHVEVLKNFDQSYVNTIPVPGGKNPRKVRESYSIDLSFRKIDVELVLEDCKIRGGINLTGAISKSIAFIGTQIGYTKDTINGIEEYVSFNGKNLKVTGDLKFAGSAKFYKKNSTINSKLDKEIVFLINAEIYLENAIVSRNLSFDNLMLNEKAVITTFFAQAHALFISNVTSHACLILTYAEIQGLCSIRDSMFLGCSLSGYSIDAARLQASDVFIREDIILKYGLCLFSCHISGTLDLSGLTVFSKIDSDIAIDLRASTVKEDIIFSPRRYVNDDTYNNFTTIFGQLLLDDASIKTLDLSRIRIIFQLGGKMALSANNLTVTAKITFSKSQHLPQFSYKKELLTEREANKYTNLLKEQETSGLTPNTKREESFLKEGSLFKNELLYSDYYAYLYLLHKLQNARPTDNTPQFEQIASQSTKQQKKEQLWLEEFKLAYSYLLNDTKVDFPEETEENISNIILETAIIVGHVSFSGLICKEQLDCASTFFYGMNPERQPKNLKDGKPNFLNASALSIKYATISGQLFLNEGPKGKRPFRAYGEVNLHSSKVEQFFVSPKRGTMKWSQWKIIGLKYEYIYSNETGKNTALEKCEWFHDYKDENNRQPYEQLALVYLKSGDDTKARRVLTRTVARDGWDNLLMLLLRMFVWLGSPPYKAIATFIVIGFIGAYVFDWGAANKGIIAVNPRAVLTRDIKTNSGKVEFSSIAYSYQHIIPFVSFDQKSMFAPSYHSGINPLPNFKMYNPFCKYYYSFDTGALMAAYQFLHTLMGSIFLAMTIIGITRIVRRA